VPIVTAHFGFLYAPVEIPFGVRTRGAQGTMHRVGAQITPTYRVDMCSRSVFSTVFARGAERCGLWLPLLLQQLVEEFTDYDSVVVFLAVGPAYNAKFFVISH